ncbi:hypothetical protein ACTXT7_014869 [Hymenolepis weldensis]
MQQNLTPILVMTAPEDTVANAECTTDYSKTPRVELTAATIYSEKKKLLDEAVNRDKHSAGQTSRQPHPAKEHGHR